MANAVFESIENIDADVFLIDIDGTLKNLCEEHTMALTEVLNKFVKFKAIKRIILAINRFAMWFVKTGILPTNAANQKVLLFIYSVLGFVNYKKFKKTYDVIYQRIVCLFNCSYEPLNRLMENKQAFFVTINKQNYNLECLGIPEERIFCSTGTVKYKTYKKLYESLNVPPSRIIIVGDNLFDDMLSAKLLATKKVLINNYNSKIKRILAKVLRIST